MRLTGWLRVARLIDRVLSCATLVHHKGSYPAYSTDNDRMTLTSSQNRYLRGLAHQTNAVILLGNRGATAAVVKELDLALDHHELVKVKLSGGDKDERQAQMAALTDGTRSERVHQVGHTVLLFRRNADSPKIALPR